MCHKIVKKFGNITDWEIMGNLAGRTGYFTGDFTPYPVPLSTRLDRLEVEIKLCSIEIICL